jgi:alpha-glucosidase
MAYCFDLLGTQKSAPFLHALFSRFLAIVGDGWPCWALSNHDCVRLATRWGGPHPDPRLLRLAAALQLSVRGTPCIYQGDELGLPEAEIAYEELQDPFGITMWPKFKGRDGCRTPMPWSAEAEQAGFGSARPWLPVSPAHRPLAVDRQEADAGSLLQFYRHLLHWRRAQPALVHGAQQMLPAHEQVLAYVREHAGQRLLCVFNFSDRPALWALPAGCEAARLEAGSGVGGARLEGQAVQLEPWGGLFAAV